MQKLCTFRVSLPYSRNRIPFLSAELVVVIVMYCIAKWTQTCCVSHYTRKKVRIDVQCWVCVCVCECHIQVKRLTIDVAFTHTHSSARNFSPMPSPFRIHFFSILVLRVSVFFFHSFSLVELSCADFRQWRWHRNSNRIWIEIEAEWGQAKSFLLGDSVDGDRHKTEKFFHQQNFMMIVILCMRCACAGTHCHTCLVWMGTRKDK